MNNKIKYIFILIELILYLIIHVFASEYLISLRYITIILCFIVLWFERNSYDNRLLKISFLITLVADLFLFVIDNYYEVGVTIFIFAQLIYGYRLLDNNKKYTKIFLSIYVLSVIMAEVIIKIILLDEFNYLTFVTVIYFVLLVNNIFNSIVFIKTNYIFAIGLILFGLCDIFVGLSNLDIYYNYAIDFAWIFYIPSQVLIALSVNKNKKPCTVMQDNS